MTTEEKESAGTIDRKGNLIINGSFVSWNSPLVRNSEHFQIMFVNAITETCDRLRKPDLVSGSRYPKKKR